MAASFSFRYRFGDARYDPARRELQVAGSSIEMEPRPLQVLELLLDRPGEFVPHRAFIRACWRDSPVAGPNLVRNAINKLRRALGKGTGSLLLTVRGGYLLQGPVERTAAPAPGTGNNVLVALPAAAARQVLAAAVRQMEWRHASAVEIDPLRRALESLS